MRNDRRLARRAARGDTDAFAAIFRRYQQDLYRYCVAILGNPQDAQDALQNTMVKALAALPGERREIELKPWLYRVAHNESIELRRRARPSAPLAEDAPAREASLEEQAADRGRLRDLLADIGELPDRQRGALVMRELAGLDFEQIGAALDTSPQAARQVLYEARRGLQQMGEGREMRCDAVTAILSEDDGRVRRRRDVRAHLRDCPDCRDFAAAIDSRGRTLAAISPLPAAAAAAIAQGALSGAAGGGASAGGVGGAAGVAGGAAAKAASTGAILKSAAGIVAIVAAGAVAVDHHQIFEESGSPAGGTGSGAAASGSGPAGAADAGSAQSDAGRVVIGVDRRTAASRRFYRRAAHGVGAGRSAAREATARTAAGGGRESSAAVVDRGASAKAHAYGGSKAHPDHPRHPIHPAHPDHPDRPTHTGSSSPAKEPAQPEHASHPKSSVPAESGNEGSAATTHPERTEHPSSQTTAEPEPTEAQAATDPASILEAAEGAAAGEGTAAGEHPGRERAGAD